MSLVTTEEGAAVKSICILGAGYVGGPTGAVLADRCPGVNVHVADVDAGRIGQWSQGPLPIHEPGLEVIVSRCRGRNLFFTTDLGTAIDGAEIVFICVPTPTKAHGKGAGMAADVSAIEQACREIKAHARGYKIVVEKSTVPCGTAASIAGLLQGDGAGAFDVLSNPEFMAEGTAIADLSEPDRVLIGAHPSGTSAAAQERLVGVYAQWIPRERILRMSSWSAELGKLAANAMLAQRISSMNALSGICEAVGADVEEVALAVGRDRRIGGAFLRAGPGFGGSCFQKDLLSLVYLARTLHLDAVAEYWAQVLQINAWQQGRLVDTVVARLHGTVAGKRVAVLGVAFKPGTGDTRESPAIGVVAGLLREGAVVRVHDPVVPAKGIQRALGGAVEVCADAYAACEGADGVVLCTGWEEFRALDYARIHGRMRRPANLFDACLLLDRAPLERLGFSVFGIGKGRGK